MPENTPKTADDLMMDYIGQLFDSLSTEFNKLNDMNTDGFQMSVENIVYTIEGKGRDTLVKAFEEQSGTKAALFAPGVNPTFTQGKITVAFK